MRRNIFSTLLMLIVIGAAFLVLEWWLRNINSAYPIYHWQKVAYGFTIRFAEVLLAASFIKGMADVWFPNRKDDTTPQ